MAKRRLTKAEALRLFKEVDNSPKGDSVWRREAWSVYTDSLCKDGYISERQYETWTNPF